MATYKYLNNNEGVYYYTRTFDSTDVTTELALHNTIYQHHVNTGMIKTPKERIVIFEFSTKQPLLNLTVLHHNSSTYRMQSQKEFDEYDKIMEKYFKINKSIGVIKISLFRQENGEPGTFVESTKESLNLSVESQLNKKVMFDNFTIKGINYLLPKHDDITFSKQ